MIRHSHVGLILSGGALLFLLTPSAISVVTDRPLDSIIHWVLLDENTIYGEGFRESQFQKVTIGMPEAEVTSLLGPPLKIVESSGGRIKALVDYVDGKRRTLYPDLPPGDQSRTTAFTYYFSQQATGSADWHLRAIRFDINLRVITILEDLIVD